MTSESDDRPVDPDYPEGARELPREGAPSEDPYTPEPGPRPGEARAFRALWLVWAGVAAVVIGVVVWLLVT